MHTRIIDFFRHDIWLLHGHEQHSLQALLIKVAKILLLAMRGFVQDHCPLRASALTLFTLLAIVPVLAMLFGIAKGFGLQELFRKRLLEQVPEQESMLQQLLSFAENLLANTQGGLMAGISVAILFFVVIKVISDIEQSFNHIWRINRGRSLGRKLSDYLSVMILAPVLLIVAGSLTVFVKTQITTFIQRISLPEFGSQVVFYLLNYLPLLIIWGLFSFTLIFMPNTRVSIKSGILAGIVSGTIFQLAQWAYVSLQVGVSSYNAIYGSFAALPLFIIWLQIAWLIVLFGCELTFYHQNFDDYRNRDKFKHLSFRLNKILALYIAHAIVQQFVRGAPPLTQQALAGQTSLPAPVLKAILAALLDAGIISEINACNMQQPAYQPARDTSLLTVVAVIEALENRGGNVLPEIKGLDGFTGIVQGFVDLLKNSEQNKLLREI